jgi:hypothetical protein
VAVVPELRGNRIILTGHTDDDVAAHVAGEDEETARRFGWWPKHSTAVGFTPAGTVIDDGAEVLRYTRPTFLTRYTRRTSLPRYIVRTFLPRRWCS